MQRRTIFSPCRRYRYCLWREWDPVNPAYALFVGLNPSTADEIHDDPTIRRCMNFARLWGYGAFCMVNLFACRTTRPALLKAQPAPIGPDNDRWILKTSRDAAITIAAWGIHGAHLHRDQTVLRLLSPQLSCLGTTQSGHPRHPLYLKKTLKSRAFA